MTLSRVIPALGLLLAALAACGEAEGTTKPLQSSQSSAVSSPESASTVSASPSPTKPLSTVYKAPRSACLFSKDQEIALLGRTYMKKDDSPKYCFYRSSEGVDIVTLPLPFAPAVLEDLALLYKADCKSKPKAFGETAFTCLQKNVDNYDASGFFMKGDRMWEIDVEVGDAPKDYADEMDLLRRLLQVAGA